MENKDLGKPTKETEMLRIWEQKDVSKKKLKEFDKEEGFEITLDNGTKIKAMGFTEMRNKDTKELVFAYKFKYPEDGCKFIIYYDAAKTDETAKMVSMLEGVAKMGGFEINDFDEHLKSVEVESGIISKGGKNEKC